MSRSVLIAAICMSIIPCLSNVVMADSKQDMANQALSTTLLSAKADNRDFNDTLHSNYLKHQVLNLADMLANAGLLAATGYIRDHKQRKYIHLAEPFADLHVAVRQSRKVRRMGQALQRTNDDDYKLAGDRMVDLADYLAIAEGEGAKFQVFLLEEFYKSDLERPSNMDDRDNAQLRAISEEVFGGVKDVLDQLSADVQQRAIEGLNLQTILGGVGNVFE